MRSQAVAFRKTAQRRKDENKKREKVFELLQAQRSIRETSSTSNVSRSTVQRIKSAYAGGQKEALSKLFDPHHQFAGRKKFLKTPRKNYCATGLCRRPKKDFQLTFVQFKACKRKCPVTAVIGFAIMFPPRRYPLHACSKSKLRECYPRSSGGIKHRL